MLTEIQAKALEILSHTTGGKKMTSGEFAKVMWSEREIVNKPVAANGRAKKTRKLWQVGDTYLRKLQKVGLVWGTYKFHSALYNITDKGVKALENFKKQD